VNPRESNPDHVAHRLTGSDAIVEAVEAARTFGLSRGLSDGELARLCIIVEELVANLYDHAGLTHQSEIEMTIARVAAGIRISIVDTGIPFDPRTIPHSERPERGGGAGLALVQAWAEILGYEASDLGNRLDLLVPLPSPE
jgi:anti-sigma regulatory factor (Ser/Thr protein kinase)